MPGCRHQHVERGLRRAFRARDAPTQLGGFCVCRGRVCAGSSDSRERELPRERRSETEVASSLLETLDQQKDIGRAAAGHCSDGIHVPLIIYPGDRAHGAQEIRAESSLCGADGRVGHENRDSLADRGRSVRHCTHDGGTPETFGQRRERLACRNRQHHGAGSCQSRARGQHGRDLIRLDGQHDDVCANARDLAKATRARPRRGRSRHAVCWPRDRRRES